MEGPRLPYEEAELLAKGPLVLHHQLERVELAPFAARLAAANPQGTLKPMLERERYGSCTLALVCGRLSAALHLVDHEIASPRLFPGAAVAALQAIDVIQVVAPIAPDGSNTFWDGDVERTRG